MGGVQYLVTAEAPYLFLVSSCSEENVFIPMAFMKHGHNKQNVLKNAI